MADQVQFCLKCGHEVDGEVHAEKCLGQATAPDETAEEEGALPETEPPVEVITGFIVVLGRGGRPKVLPLDLGGVKLVCDREASATDIQAACREISDDLLAHRSAEYADLTPALEAITDILGEMSVRMPDQAASPSIERFKRARGDDR